MSGLKDHEIAELVTVLKEKLQVEFPELKKQESLRARISTIVIKYLEARNLRTDKK